MGNHETRRSQTVLTRTPKDLVLVRDQFYGHKPSPNSAMFVKTPSKSFDVSLTANDDIVILTQYGSNLMEY